MLVAVDLGISNIGSVLKAFRSLGCTLHVTDRPEDVEKADKILLPGVGAFGAGMAAIHRLGLYTPLRDAALVRGVPFLGVCLGMQLLAKVGYERGRAEGLGVLDSEVHPLDPSVCRVIPHMGWNNLETTSGNPLLAGLSENPDFYFVHGFHMTHMPPDTVVNSCDFYGPIVGAFARGNVFGMQFHPEKSQKNGLQVLRNFIQYKGELRDA